MSRSRSRRKRSSGRRNPSNNNNDNSANDSDNDSDNGGSSRADNDNGSPRANRFTTETMQATKTTELIAYVAAVIGVVMTALHVDKDPDFGAERAWLYITILTMGYMISRGLAKAGSHERHNGYDE